MTAANRYGVAPIALASLNGSASMLARLLAAGADANRAQPEGETAVMTAARTGRVEAVRILLDHGADVDAAEQWRGQTALMWAAAEGHTAAVRELIARGADVDARSGTRRNGAERAGGRPRCRHGGRSSAAAGILRVSLRRSGRSSGRRNGSCRCRCETSTT